MAQLGIPAAWTVLREGDRLPDLSRRATDEVSAIYTRLDPAQREAEATPGARVVACTWHEVDESIAAQAAQMLESEIRAQRATGEWTQLHHQVLRGVLHAIVDDFTRNEISMWLSISDERWGPKRVPR